MTELRAKIRLDKWLWHARFFKTRSLASKQVGGGHIRVNGQKVSKPAHAVGPEDVLSFAQGERIRIIKVLAIGERRGPASEAQTLYQDQSPEQDKRPPSVPRAENSRPTKKDRRKFDLIQGKTLD
jgi:ribosome-associated heat shock protein Hsp15